MENILIIQTVAISIIAGAFCMVLSDRLKFPSIIFYLFSGIVLGPHALNLVRPECLGRGLQILIIIFVIIILFEGGLSLNPLRLIILKSALVKQVIAATAITVPVSWLCAHYIAGMTGNIAIVFAFLTVVTGPTVIKPIIRHLALGSHVKTFLNSEAVLIDAFGAVLSIMALEYVVSQQVLGTTIMGFILSLSTGVAIGASFGYFIKKMIIIAIPQNSRSIFIFGILFLVYLISEFIASESGFMAVAVFGILCSTINYREKERLIVFKEQLSRISISFLFILLSANFNLVEMHGHLRDGIIIVALIIISRFPVVFISTRREKFSINERLFMGWIGPRGIISLSIASIAAIKLQDAGMKAANLIEIYIFMLIAGTVLLQGISAGWLTKKLSILVHGDRNIMILGINAISLSVAREWRKYQNDVLLIDSKRDNCKLAKMEGLPFIHGNALDPAAFIGFEMENYTSALAASENDEINILFCRFVKETYGISNLYAVLTDKAGSELAEIIKNDGIQTAYAGSDKEIKKYGLLKNIFGYITRSRPHFESIKITNRDFIAAGPKVYPIPDDVVILFVVRNQRSCHIFHNDITLEYNDLVFIILLDPKKRELLSVFSSN
jgi:NhaP-type Na+/H+ or K+/H+ antiporter/Trk K+ transport system NAD-binding subunit